MTLTVLLGSVSVFALSLTEPDTTVEQNLVSVINHTCASPAATSRNVSRETNILRAEQKSQTRRTFSPELLFSWKSWKVWCVLVESRVCSALFLWACDAGVTVFIVSTKASLISFLHLFSSVLISLLCLWSLEQTTHEKAFESHQPTF